ncbi:hypothetical protein GUJ93_ZPchr0011g27768 [Zizania palustris]|uniref:Uncharacterized protein n=1 Tax=Zizania palustris TaxID=103762 RepID=A0A8J5WIA9_ZIZPA|nr:hypothetical protein GUJ93_ZPchr0011g27768 [Zizania palustris]
MGAGSAPVWRSSVVALCLLPVVVPLVLLGLPLLCFAVAVVRFRRRRRRMKTAVTKGSGCYMGGGERPSPEREEDGGHRAALLHKYLQDQMELVGAKAGKKNSMRAQSKKAEFFYN